MRKKKPLITKGKKVLENYSIYTLFERLKYWKNNKFFTGYFRIPTNKDIHINNVWKDIKYKSK